MFTFLRTLSGKQILTEQMPALMAALLVSELFFKFHSFSLECLGFLLTWFAFDALLQGLKRRWIALRPSPPPSLHR